MKKLINGAAALLLVLASVPAAAGAVTLNCTVSEKWTCAMGAACRSNAELKMPIRSWSTYDTDAHVYARCDPTGCDPYQALEARSGVFTNIEIPGKGAFAKIGPDGVFVEVISQITGVWVSYGRCQVAGLPR